MTLDDVKTILKKHDLECDRDWVGVGVTHFKQCEIISISDLFLIEIYSSGSMRIGDLNELPIPEWFAHDRSDDSEHCPPGLVEQFWKFRPALIEICEFMGLYDHNKEYSF